MRVPTPVRISCTHQRVSPINSRSHRLLLLNFIITPLLAPAPGPHQPGLIASKVGEPGEPRMPSPLDLLSSAMSSLIGTSSRPTSPAPDHHHPDLYGGSPLDRNDCQFVANSGALGYPTKQTFLSPLDLLSSAISSTGEERIRVP